MTVSAQTPINRSTGNGVTTVFPYTFKIISSADMEVSVDGVVKTLTVDYTLSGVGDDAGGNVTMLAAPATSTSVVRRRNMALTRNTDYQDQGELPASTLDSDLDSAVLMIQQVDEKTDRAMVLPADVSGFSTELPTPIANYFLRVNSAGTALELASEITPGALTVTPFIETLLNDSMQADARTTLGAAASGANTDITSLGSIASINGGALAGFRNKLINGGMTVQQRPDNLSLTSTYQYGRCDRWAFKVVGGSGISSVITRLGNVADVSTGAMGGIIGAWTGGKFYATQRIEAADSYGLGTKTITFSVKVFQDSGASRNFRLAILKPGGLNSWGSEVVLGTSAALAVPHGVFTLISFTMTLAAYAANSGLAVSVYDDAAVTFVAGTSTMLGDAQLEIGTVATAFEQRPYGMELALCQRYYEVGSALLQSATTGTAGTSCTYRAIKRVNPTRVYSTSYGSANGLVDISTFVTQTDALAINFNVIGVGGYVNFTWTASAEL